MKYLTIIPFVFALCIIASCSSKTTDASEIFQADEPQEESDFRAASFDLDAPFLREPMMDEGVFRFGKGDSFLWAMKMLGASGEASSQVLSSVKDRCGLDQIAPGTEMSYRVIEGKGVASLDFPCGTYEIVHARFDGDKPTIDVEEIPHHEGERVYFCKVLKNSSIIASAAKQGITEAQVMQLAKAFRSDIDFNNDIFPGDELRVWIKETQDEKGKTLATGKIIAALFMLKGKEYWGIYYEGADGKGYFDKKGKSLVKSFIKSPLPFLRVTSGFTLRRFHPILGINRPHEGIDFGAPIGTPVFAAANGKVIEAGWQGGYGNAIKIKNSSSLTTMYGHLSKIRVRRGQYVRQGQVIGNVGTTGLSTGPHLHYGMYQNGKAIDPMSVKMDATLFVNSKVFRERRDNAVRLLSAPNPGPVKQ